MAIDLRNRGLTKELDLTPEELGHLVELGLRLKAAKRAGAEDRRLAGRNIALIFEKTSTRTRCAFEVAAADQGAHTTYLDPAGSQIGHKESIADTARVLGRMFDAIEYRGFGQEVVEELAEHAGVPVYNGLTDTWHPTQMLADLMTMREHTGRPLAGTAHAYLGDARSNMGNSTLVSGAMTGLDVRLVAPKELWPTEEVIAAARGIAERTGARITLTEDVAEGVRGADFVSTDVWVSMGEPAEVWAGRIEKLLPYQVNAETLRATGKESTRFLHCLPAYHDLGTELGRKIHASTGLSELEVTDEVFSGPASIVFDQAENRMHSIKAVLVASLGR